MNYSEQAADLVRSKGHTFLRYESSVKVIYICGNCGTTNQSSKGNLERTIGHACPSCRNAKGPRYQQKVSRLLHRKGMKLAAPFQNIRKVKIICRCGKVVTAPLYEMLKKTCTHAGPPAAPAAQFSS